MSVENEILNLIERELDGATDKFVTTDDFEYMVGEALGWGGTVDINDHIDFDTLAESVRELLDLDEPPDYTMDMALMQTKVDALEDRQDRLESIITDTFRILLNRLSA